MTPRFLIDHGTATLSAALVAPLDGSWRLVDMAAFPSAAELDAVLAFVAGRAAGLSAWLPEMARARKQWPEWERVEATSVPPRQIALAAPTARRLAELEAAALQAGWSVAARITPERSDALAASRLIARANVRALALAAHDPARGDEARPLAELAAIAGAVAGRRDDLLVILCGAAIDQVEHFPMERIVYAPAPASLGGSTGGDALVRLLTGLSGQADGARLAAAKGAAALATVLERTIELVDVGASGAGWFRARPPAPTSETAGESTPETAGESTPETAGESELEGFLLAGGALPDESSGGDAGLDAVIAWSPLHLDRQTHLDRLRDLHTHPWQEAAGEGAILRMAAARAALARLETTRERLGGLPAERMAAPDILVVAGGAFAPAPGPAIALAAADTLRRPGLMQLAYDHARLLAPLGRLVPKDRLAVATGIAADLLLPVGSALMLDSARPGREAGRARVTSNGATSEPLVLAGGALRVVELPPGASAEVALEVRDGRLGETRAQRLGFQVSGGLAGLIIDTRGIPLRLPQRSERRREVIGQWQRALWPGAE